MNSLGIMSAPALYARASTGLGLCRDYRSGELAVAFKEPEVKRVTKGIVTAGKESGRLRVWRKATW